MKNKNFFESFEAVIYGQYAEFWKYNFEENEIKNSKEAFDQIIAIYLGYLK